MKVNNAIIPLASVVVAFSLGLCINFPWSEDLVVISAIVALLAFALIFYYSYFTNLALRRLRMAEDKERAFLRSIRHDLSNGKPISKERIAASLAASKEAERSHLEAYGYHRPEYGVLANPTFCGSDWHQIKNSQ